MARASSIGRTTIGALLVGCALLGAACAEPDRPAASGRSGADAVPLGHVNEDILIARQVEPFVGDLPEIRSAGRRLRALVTYGKTGFFLDGAQIRGITYEGLSSYEEFLNRGVTDRSKRIEVVFLPVPLPEVLPALEQGLGDVAAAALTITPERQARVAFSVPFIAEVDEVVVVNRDADDLRSIEDLAGRRIHVRAGSSYVGHLHALGAEVVEADAHLATEDLLELVNAGVLDMTVADAPLASLWAQVLPDVVVRDDLVVHEGSASGWAVRKGNPELLASINDFVRQNAKGTAGFNIVFKRYYQNKQWVQSPLDTTAQRRLAQVWPLAQEYGERYDIDPIDILAQAYQESRLDHEARSRAGAVGVMQMQPRTAADANVDIPDIRSLRNNVHAAVKYLAFLRERYFSDAGIAPADRMDFTWAAYNAGPGRIVGLRRTASDRGLNPDVWSGNVEQVAAAVIGRETVDYVSNVNKYHAAYKLYFDLAERRDRAKEAVASPAR